MASAFDFTYHPVMTHTTADFSDRLKRASQVFYGEVFSDPMIGFMFHGLDQGHLIEREYELMAKVCGLDVRYEGRPLKRAHSRHNIRRGQFNRRLVLLVQALESTLVDQVHIDTIVEHNQKLAPMILGAALNDSSCNHPKDATAASGVKVYT